MIEPIEPAPSQLVGDRYRLVGRIGRGGMGEVWLARDELLDRDVAAKRILTVSGADTEQATIRRRRAIREARAAARLSHPHAVAMFDVVVDDNDPWLVMEYFPSVSVADLLRTVGALAPIEAAQIAVHVAQALAQAHAAGLVHRDLKPGNILVSTAVAGSTAGVVKVADFGIARSDDDPAITRSGIVTGTPTYFSPEVARGAEPTSASDVYALGATLYTMVEGRPPHSDSDNVIATLHRISSTEVRPMTVETDLDVVVARLLDRDVDRRPSMAAARELLADWVAASASTADLSRLADRSDTAGELSSSPATLLPSTPSSSTPSSSTPGRRTRSVPAELTSFVGRVDDLNEVNGLLHGHRMVVVTGPGGVGKTRLAQRIALSRDDADGPWFVEFDGVGDASGVADALISALGITAPGGLAAVIQNLAFRTCLLVFDNCEHLVDPIADAAHQILQACPQVSVVATSRTSLGVPGERRHALAPPDDGTALFIARSPHPVSIADLDDVRRLCDAVDHLPLAIELAAARTRILSVRQVLSGLSDNLNLLRRDDSGRHSRRTSLSAVIGESFQALTASRRTLLTELSVFVGSFDVDAIAAVTGRETGLVDDLAGLVDESLVTVVGGDPRRYRLLDTVRTFAADQMGDQRRAEVTARRLEWTVALAAEAFAGLRGPASTEWMKRVDADMPTIRVTLDDALGTDPVAYARIVGDLYWIWYRRGRIDEGCRLLDAILDEPGSAWAVDTVVVRCLVGRALLAHLAGDFHTIAACGDRLRELADGFGEEPRPGEQRRAAAEAAAMLSYLSAGAGELTATRESAARARRFAIAEGSAWTAAEIEIALSVAAMRGGDPVEARSHLDVMRRTAEEHGFGWLHTSALWLLAKNILRSTGDTAEPRELLTRMITACDRESDLTSWMVGMATLAYVEFVDDDHERASLLLGAVARRSDESGFHPEKLDPVDMAEFTATMAASMPAGVLRAGDEAGRSLDRNGIAALVAACARRR